MKRLYVVVRSDLSAGMQLAQACHAARDFTRDHPLADVGDNLVVLEASGEQLAVLVTRVTWGGVDVTAFHEPDLGGMLTAAAFGGQARKLVSQLPLAGRFRAA